jgi:hypothetical protein
MQVVVDVEPLVHPILVVVDQLVIEVDLTGLLPHLDTISTNYSKKIIVGLRLHPEDLPEHHPMGPDAHECLKEVDKDRGCG